MIKQNREMKLIFSFAAVCMFIFTIHLCHLSTSFNGEILQSQLFLGDVAISCGSISNSTALDGRHWSGDVETPGIQPKGNSRTAVSAGKLLMADPTPFFRARVSSTYFSYSFQVNPGQKFVRLHFYPAPYQGFRNSRDFFTVKANSFILLQNFSASLAADELGVRFFVKEYCLTVNETGILQITFSASVSKKKTFVFVNGIEIISMPTDLYYTPFDNQGANIVGHHNHFYYVDNSTALELIQRLNVGGGLIIPVEDDTGMFRRWGEDGDYVLASSEFDQIRNPMPAIDSPVLAPLKIYQTSRIMKKVFDLKEKHHFTWKIPLNLGFSYLLRLHFCSCSKDEIVEAGQVDFSISIQNVVVETGVNVIQLSGGNGIAVYRDYLVMLKGDKTEGKCDLLISLQSFDELVLGVMKGLEIFKLSNTENSLASSIPLSPNRNSSFWSVKIRNILVGFGKFNMIMAALTVFLALTSAAVYQLRQICEHKFWQWQEKDKPVRLSLNEPSCYHFSLAEILLATQNFNEALVIGKGGFGKVYKGIVNGHPEVLAIKRLKRESNQGAREFSTEIETLSKLRHFHLVPLLGYCNESEEMILVYEYMSRGTIADNTYKAREGTPLTWEQRLRICIGAARGLEYLHTGTQRGIIHRDVKDTNILLDENYVAKISDFGLSREGSTAETQDQFSTKVKGTIGYLDPHYLVTHKPSITSDVYSFGIVLLVVLSGRPAVEINFPGEIVSLLGCFQECMEKGETKDIIDPSIQSEISVESLTKFLEAVENCLHQHPKQRATMAQLVVILEHALEKSRALVTSTLNDDKIFVNQPLPVESNQPFEENAVYFPVEETTNKEIQKLDLATKEEVLKPRETDPNITQRPLWGRKSWFAIKNILKRDSRFFLLKDIKLATRNFSDEFKIMHGDHYDIYKVFIDGSGILEIKRARSDSVEARETFKAQIKFLKLGKPHINLVPILGYCDEGDELILACGYTSNVYTLNNHIFRKCKNNVLTFEERLRIYRDAATGLQHLHKYHIVHKDVNIDNIILDENLVPKVSGFGCFTRPVRIIRDTFSLMGSGQSRRYVGTPAYVDPYYAVTGMLTEASDVYAFGIVMLVVLSGRPPVNDKKEILALWFMDCVRKGMLEEIMDLNLQGMKIPSKSLKILVKLINRCLSLVPKDRPEMGQVVADIDAALYCILPRSTGGKEILLKARYKAKIDSD